MGVELYRYENRDPTPDDNAASNGIGNPRDNITRGKRWVNVSVSPHREWVCRNPTGTAVWEEAKATSVTSRVASALATIGGSAGDTLTMSGSTAMDGSGGTFVLVAGTASAGIKYASSTPGFVWERLRNSAEVHAAWFGARSGATAAENSVALAAAIAAWPENGTLRLPGGVLLYDTTLEFSKNGLIKGCHTELRYTGTGTAAKFRKPGTGAYIELNLCDLRITGRDTSVASTSVAAKGVEVHKALRSEWPNFRVEGFDATPTTVGCDLKGCTDFTLRNLVSRKNGVAVDITRGQSSLDGTYTVPANDVKLHEPRLTENTGTAFRATEAGAGSLANGVGAFNGWIEGNGGYGMHLDGVQRFETTGCRFEANTTANVRNDNGNQNRFGGHFVGLTTGSFHIVNGAGSVKTGLGDIWYELGGGAYSLIDDAGTLTERFGRITNSSGGQTDYPTIGGAQTLTSLVAGSVKAQALSIGDEDANWPVITLDASGVLAWNGADAIVRVDTYAAAATDDLVSIDAAPGYTLKRGNILCLFGFTGSRVPYVRTSGNIRMGPDNWPLATDSLSVILVYDGTYWKRLGARADEYYFSSSAPVAIGSSNSAGSAITPSRLDHGHAPGLYVDGATGIVASTTQVQGQTPLTRRYNNVITVANPNDVATLPPAVANRHCVVVNSGANTLQLFPESGDDLGAGVDASTTIVAGNYTAWWAIDATNWKRVG